MDFIYQVQDMNKNWGELGKDYDKEEDIQGYSYTKHLDQLKVPFQ